ACRRARGVGLLESMHDSDSSSTAEDRMTNPRWVAYTDGACSGNPGPAAWGAVVLAPGGEEVAAHSGFIGFGTNQIAEIKAAIEGLSRTPEGAEVELVSDSQYVLKGL